MICFILVHDLAMHPVVVNAADISYINEDEGVANIFLRSASGEAITCHESMEQICDLLNEEFEGNAKIFRGA